MKMASEKKAVGQGEAIAALGVGWQCLCLVTPPAEFSEHGGCFLY